MSDIFGQSNYGGNYIKKKYAKLKDGEAAYRILPALGELAAQGKWSVFWKVHYGYKNSKGELRTFESPLVKNNKSKMIEVPDAALERIETLKAAFEAAKKANDGPKIAALDKLVGQKGQYNLDSNHYMNAIDEQGNIVILKIRHRAKVALDAAIKRERAKGIDPLSPTDGRFFVFHRSGMGLDTVFQVSVKQETVDVPGFGPMQRDIVHKLTPEIANRCGTRQPDGSFRYAEAANLDTLYKKPTSEQVARIVKEGAAAVDEILDTKGGQHDEPPADDYEDNTSSAPVAQNLAPAPAPAAAPAQPSAQEAMAAEIARLQAQIASTQAQAYQQVQAPLQQAAPVQAAPATTPAPTAAVNTGTPAPSAEEQDFLKSLGL